MSLDNLERDIVDFMGEMRAEVRNLKEGQKSQGERIGILEARITQHFEAGHSNGSGWRQKATYASGGGIGLVAVIELIRKLIT